MSSQPCHRRFLGADVRSALDFFGLPKRDGPNLQSQNFSKKRSNFFGSAAGRPCTAQSRRPSFRAPIPTVPISPYIRVMVKLHGQCTGEVIGNAKMPEEDDSPQCSSVAWALNTIIRKEFSYQFLQ